MQKLNSMTELSQRLNEIDPELVARKQKQIAGLRYKLYAFLCVVGILFFWGMFAGAVERVRWLWALPLGEIFGKGPQYVFLEARGSEWLLNELDLIQTSISWAIDEVAAIKEIQEVIQELNTTGKQYTLANCINEKKCDNIKPKLMENLPFFRTYIILSSLEAQKMDFNQKVLLKSVLEHVMKVPWWTGDIGALLSISFGGVQVLDEENYLYKLPITMEIEFKNKQDFLVFLKNVEQSINFLIPMVYRIAGMNYDIVDYNLKQTVSVELYAYFYNPPQSKTPTDSWTTTPPPSPAETPPPPTTPPPA